MCLDPLTLWPKRQSHPSECLATLENYVWNNNETMNWHNGTDLPTEILLVGAHEGLEKKSEPNLQFVKGFNGRAALLRKPGKKLRIPRLPSALRHLPFDTDKHLYIWGIGKPNPTLSILCLKLIPEKLTWKLPNKLFEGKIELKNWSTTHCNTHNDSTLQGEWKVFEHNARVGWRHLESDVGVVACHDFGFNGLEVKGKAFPLGKGLW